jgi:hypothetical protein
MLFIWLSVFHRVEFLILCDKVFPTRFELRNFFDGRLTPQSRPFLFALTYLPKHKRLIGGCSISKTLKLPVT